MDVIPVIVNIVARESAFDKSRDEEMSEMSSKEYPVRLKKNHGREGGKLPPPAAKNNGKRN